MVSELQSIASHALVLHGMSCSIELPVVIISLFIPV